MQRLSSTRIIFFVIIGAALIVVCAALGTNLVLKPLQATPTAAAVSTAEAQGTPKDLYVYPLCRRVQQRLVAAVPPVYQEPLEEILMAERPATHP